MSHCLWPNQLLSQILMTPRGLITGQQTFYLFAFCVGGEWILGYMTFCLERCRNYNLFELFQEFAWELIENPFCNMKRRRQKTISRGSIKWIEVVPSTETFQWLGLTRKEESGKNSLPTIHFSQWLWWNFPPIQGQKFKHTLPVKLVRGCTRVVTPSTCWIFSSNICNTDLMQY